MPIHLLIMRIVLAFVLYTGVLFGISLDFGWVMGWVPLSLTLVIASLDINVLNLGNPRIVREWSPQISLFDQIGASMFYAC